MPLCNYCHSSIDGTVYRNTLCFSCGKELHSCVNCRHYAKGRPYDCNESIQEPVTDKSRANFCDFFQINQNSNASPKGKNEKKLEAKDAFDALFGD